MVGILNRIKSIIKSDIIVCGSKHAHVLLEEEKNAALTGPDHLKKIRLKDFGGARILIKTDKGTEYKGSGKKNGKKLYCMSPLFNSDGSCQHNRVCDGVILEEIGQHDLRVVLIELKSTVISGAETQLKNTKYFIEYLISLVRDFHGEEVGKVYYSSVILHTQRGSIPKRTTRPPLKHVSKKVEGVIKLVVKNNDEISINQLF